MTRQGTPFCRGDVLGNYREDLNLLLGQVFPSDIAKFG
jgi:hypothetical protein